MEIFDFSESLRLSKQTMSVVGFWPVNRTRKHNIGVLVVMLMITGCIICNAMAMFCDANGPGDVLYALCILLASGKSISKFLTFLVAKTKTIDLLNFLVNPLFTSHGEVNAQLNTTMTTAGFFRKLVFFLVMGTAGMIALVPFLGFKGKFTPLPQPFDISNASLTVYLSTCIFQASGAGFVAFVISAFDSFLIMLMAVPIAELKVLAINIKNSADWNSRDSSKGQEFNNVVNGRLRKCILHHMAIESYMQQMESKFSFVLLIQLIESLILTAFVGYICVITPVTNPTFGKGVFFFLASTVELATYCIAGNEIILQSEKVRDACYMSEWTDCDVSVRKTLFIIMERAKQPFQLTAGKFVVLNHETFLSILNSSFFYYTVLRHMVKTE